MKLRSPVMGFNHNVKHLGRVYHVQTEDSGVKNPHLFTHVFFGGTILATKKVVYDAGADEAMVRALMQKQHKEMLREFKTGSYDDKLRAFFVARGEAPELLGDGPLESEPEEINPRGAAAVQQAMAAASQWEQMAAKAAAEKPAAAPTPFADGDDDAPVITLGAPPAPRAPSRPGTPAAAARPAPAPSSLDADAEGPVVTLEAPAPRAPSRPATPTAPIARRPTPTPSAPVARRPTPTPSIPNEEDGPVITLAPPPGAAPRHTEPSAPKAATSTMARRIWAKKGGSAERPFEDSGVFNALSGAGARQQSGELPGKPANKTGPAEIVDLPPQSRSSAPAREEDGPVVVLAPPRVTSTPQPPRPVAAPAAQAASSRHTATRTSPARVQIAAPSADGGVVISRPSSVVVSGSVQSGTPARPVPPVAQPTVARSTGTHSAVAATGGSSANKASKLPAVAREASDSIFGEDLISEKSLDEVILAYLAEDAKHLK